VPRVPTSSRFGFVYVVFVVWFFFFLSSLLGFGRRSNSSALSSGFSMPFTFLYVQIWFFFCLDLKFLHVFYCEYKLVCTTFLFLHVAYVAMLMFFSWCFSSLIVACCSLHIIFFCLGFLCSFNLWKEEIRCEIQKSSFSARMPSWSYCTNRWDAFLTTLLDYLLVWL
jgi:hypothetical protein